jgi:hypothetical protein
VFENRVLKIYGSNRGKVEDAGEDCIKRSPHNLHTSINIIRVIKSRWVRLARHSARKG